MIIIHQNLLNLLDLFKSKFPKRIKMNRGLRRDNTTGYTGVVWSNASGKYLANIKINQKRIHLGTFSKIEDAVKARREAEEKYFGEYRFNESLTNKK